LGSRAKMGTGVNVQRRITALHHIDCPWRPSDITQSTGGFEPIVYDFNIPKDKNGTDTNEIETKQNQMADILQDNINLLFAEKETPREIAEYKGFKVYYIF